MGVQIKSEEVVSAVTLEVLTRLYFQVCDCRRLYEELADIVDPRFHLDDCHYRELLESVDFKY